MPKPPAPRPNSGAGTSRSNRKPVSQRGFRIHGWGEDPVWEEFARPAPAGDEVLVQVEACGVGLTVLNCIRGDLANSGDILPRVPGHELVGRVIEAGPGRGGRLVGRRIVAYFYLVCGSCHRCLAGAEPRCVNLAGWVGVHRDGGYAPFTVLPIQNVMEIPESLDPVAATVIPDAVATAIHVCRRRCEIGPGDRVVVIGAAGGVGIHVMQVARLCGGDVVGLDVGDRKLGALAELGFEAVDSGDFHSLTRTLPGRPPDAIIDLVGTEASLQWALRSLGSGGRLAVLTTFPGVATTVDPRHLVLEEISVLGSKYASRAEVMAATELVAGGLVTPIVGRQVDAQDSLSLHDDLLSGTLIGRGAIRW